MPSSLHPPHKLFLVDFKSFTLSGDGHEIAPLRCRSRNYPPAHAVAAASLASMNDAH